MSNAAIHAGITRKQYGGNDADYEKFIEWHDFMDCSKEVESSNRHRVMLHSIWGIKQVLLPIFGHTYTTSEGKQINLKDCLEVTHLLADFGNKFIPNLADYVDLISDDAGDVEMFEAFRTDNQAVFRANPEVEALLLSPMANTGKVKSLLVTHNSWFLQTILPKLFPLDIPIKNYSIDPSTLFRRMAYADWIQNGHGAPPSYAKINEYRKSKIKKLTKISHD